MGFGKMGVGMSYATSLRKEIARTLAPRRPSHFLNQSRELSTPMEAVNEALVGSLPPLPPSPPLSQQALPAPAVAPPTCIDITLDNREAAARMRVHYLPLDSAKCDAVRV